MAVLALFFGGTLEIEGLSSIFRFSIYLLSTDSDGNSESSFLFLAVINATLAPTDSKYDLIVGWSDYGHITCSFPYFPSNLLTVSFKLSRSLKLIFW